MPYAVTHREVKKKPALRILAGNTSNKVGMGVKFCPAGNWNGDFKYPHNTQGGAGIIIPIPASIQYEIIILPLSY